MMIEGVPGSSAPDQSRARTDKLKDMKQYGLHRHFTGGSSIMMWGGGVKKGHVYGATADERPLMAVKDPLSIEDLHATIYTIMGINPKTAYEVEKRPLCNQGWNWKMCHWHSCLNVKFHQGNTPALSRAEPSQKVSTK